MILFQVILFLMKSTLPIDFIIFRATLKEEKTFACPVCQKQFTRIQSLSTHMKVHLEEKPFSCSTCGKPFSQKKSLLKHEESHRVQLAGGALVGSEMEDDNSFKVPSLLTNHFLAVKQEWAKYM